MLIKGLLFPASILAGTIVGAGFFALPFVFQKSGILTGFFYLAFFAVFLVISYLIYGDIIVRTPGEHRFVGYAKMYLGNWGYWLTVFFGLIPLIFALTIYLILAPSFSRLFLDGNFIYHLLAFWLAGSAIILLNVKRIAFVEFLIVLGTVLIIFLVFGFGAEKIINLEIDWVSFNFLSLAAIGPVLFALSGAEAVPEMVSYFREAKIPSSFFRGSLVLGMAVPAIMFLFFVAAVFGLSPEISEDAVSGLIGRVPDQLLGAVGILGLISLMSSYIILGLNAREVFFYDLKWPDWLSRALIVILPLGFYFLGFRSFISLVSNVGGIFVPFGGALIIWMWYRANKQLKTPPVFVGKYIQLIMPFLFVVFLAVTIYFLFLNGYN